MMNVFHMPSQVVFVVHVGAANVAVMGISVSPVDDRLMAPKVESVLEILLTDLTVEERGARSGSPAVRVEVSHVALQIKVAVEILVADVAEVRRRIAQFEAPIRRLGGRRNDDKLRLRQARSVGRRHVQNLAAANGLRVEIHFRRFVLTQGSVLQIG